MGKNAKWPDSDAIYPPDFDSDLNWMFQSGQVNRSLLFKNLAYQYYSSLYRVAFSFLNDHRAARVVVEQTLSKAINMARQYSNDMGVGPWLYQICWRESLRVYRKELVWRRVEALLHLHGELSEHELSTPPSETGRIIWQTIDCLPAKPRFLYILLYGHKWSIERITQITGEAQRFIETEIDQAQERITKNLLQATQPILNLDQLIFNSLQARWFIPQISMENIDHRLEYLIQTNSGDIPRGNIYATFREVLVLLIALVMVSVLLWVGISS
jgi:DNA-directed RNA polymerase specialized sigma24 family protein